MTRDEVMDLEDATLIDAEQGLLFKGTFIGSDCFIFYRFNEYGALTTAAYRFDSPDDKVDVADFTELEERLTKKYGVPEHAGIEWKDPRRAYLIETVGELAKVVGIGQAKLQTAWRTEDTVIRLVLTEDKEKYNAIVWLFYEEFGEAQQRLDQRERDEFDLL